jgi:putative ubiquitin-RnfH superfamily antitoxin RatB of RatAB toxin-antitoxin module
MRISVAIAVPSRQEVVEIDLPEGSTVADAIAAVKPQSRFAGIALETVEAGVWGARVAGDAVLRDGDRVELYRALKADPKDQRRRRVRPKPSPRSRSGP